MTLVHSRLAALAVAVTGAVAAPGCSTSNGVAGRAEAGTPPGSPSTHVVEPEGGLGIVPSGDAALSSDGTIAPAATTSEPPTDGGTPADSTVSDGSAQPVVQGAGAPCTASGALTVGTKVTVNTTWAASAAVAQGAGPAFVWLLSTYDIGSGGQVTGTTATCGMQLPVITFSAFGNQVMGRPAGQMDQQQIVIPATSWSGVPLAAVTGTLGSWNVGSSIAIDPVVMLYGLAGTSALASGSTTWPASVSAIAPGDLTYANGAPYSSGTGVPGIVATYDSAPPYYLPATALTSSAPTATAASLVLRVQLRLYGTSTSCTAQSGQAFVSDLDSRIIGCNLSGGGGPCSSTQYGFLDANDTQFVPGTGTFVAQQLSSGASCSDVLSALP